jgi:subtilisin family serine protease
MEWELAPYPQGGNPLTDGRPDLAPNIVNNSWSCPPLEGCDAETLHEATARLRQAGIFQANSAGNTGSACSTIDVPPEIYDETFSVTAADSSRNIAGFASRGPVTVDGSGRLKPDLSAPGNLVNSSIPDGRYASKSGTSMAAPHVAGAVALLWSYRPALRGYNGLTECALTKSASTNVGNTLAQTCGGIPVGVFPNNVSGYGMLDAYAALTLPMSDADPAPDACDCAPADASAFAAPAAIEDLIVAGAGTLQWTNQGAETGSGTRYDVLRGDIASLRASGGIFGAACFANGITVASANDPEVPGPGVAFYYLVRSRNACGGAGWGGSRVNTACD